MDGPLAGKVALVAGGTRAAGRGIAVELGAAGATVYVTGRTTRAQQSEMKRPETIEETAELVDAAGGKGIAIRVDHLVPEQVPALVDRIDDEQGALHVLVNDIWGATTMEWDKSVWESSLDIGLRTLRLGIDTHAITSHFALPLLIKTPGGLVVEVNDGTDEYNDDELPGVVLLRPREGRGVAHGVRARPRARAPRMHRGVAHAGLAAIRGDARRVRRHRGRTGSTRRRSRRTSRSRRALAFVGRAVAALAQDPDVARWNGQSLSSGQLAQVYGFTDVDGSQPDAWRYLVEVQDAGKPADTTGYR